MQKDIRLLTQKLPKSFDGTAWTYTSETFRVEVLAVARGYAMVRRSRCIPFVVNQKDLQRINHTE